MDEPLLIHLALEPFRAHCGADVPNQRTAPPGSGKVTCPECILKHPEADAWNQRYLCYAAAHQREPEAQLAHDRLGYPGGRMAGYIRWIEAKTRQYKALDRGAMDFDTWLTVVARRPRGDVPKLLRRAATVLGRWVDPEIAREVQAELHMLINVLFTQADVLEEAQQIAKASEELSAQVQGVEQLDMLAPDIRSAVVLSDRDASKNGVYRRAAGGWERAS